MEEQSEDMAAGVNFMCKYNICLVCAATISESNDGLKFAEDGFQKEPESVVSICPDVFFKGMLVLCEKLNVERKYADKAAWGLSEEDNFVPMICCNDCYALIKNLASLQELIITTQTALDNDIKKVENCIVKSEMEPKDFEYSINACLQFRHDVLNNFTSYTSLDKTFPGASESTTTTSRPFWKSTRRVRRYQHLLRKARKRDPKARRVEPLNVQQTVKEEHSPTVTDSDFEETVYEEINSPLITNESDLHQTDCEVETEESYHTQQELPRKRGRPRKHFPKVTSEENVVKRKPGRPRKHPVPVFENEVIPGEKRKRGRPRKCVEGPCRSVTERSRSRIPSGIRHLSHDKKGEHEYETKIRKQGRPLKHNRNVIPEGVHPTTIYVLNYTHGIFMYLNIKFKKEGTFLLCKHPDCSYSIPGLGYFADQTAYRAMRLHIRNEHRRKYNVKGEEDRKKYQCCCHCDMLFHTKRELLAHKREVHPDVLEPLTLCEICGEVLHHQNIFRHLKTHKSEEEKALGPVIIPKRPIVRKNAAPPMGTRTFPCSQCGKVFYRKGQQQIHEQSHIPVELRRQVICDICGCSVTSTHNLKIHKQYVHFKADVQHAFKCHICGKTFMSNAKGRYESHLNVHLKRTPYQCADCGKQFYGKRNLVLHEASHKETSIQCAYCPKWYKSEKYLKRHQVAHHPETLQKKQRSDLSQEQRKELIGPKLMFPCEPCNMVFVYKSRLVKHLKEKHGLMLEKSEDYPSQLTFEDDLATFTTTAASASI